MPDPSTTPGAGRPTPPPQVESYDGEYLAVLASSAADAVEKARAEFGLEADGLEPVEVDLTPIGGVPGCDEFWTENVAVLAHGVFGDPDFDGELKILGAPVSYWRLRDGC